MARKPTYKELEERIRELEKRSSKRKRVENALGEFLVFKEKIISESPIGMSIYDASGQCVAANDSIGELIGATKEQVLKQNYNNIESWKKSGMLDKAKSAIRENSKKRHALEVKSTFGKDVSFDCHLVPFLSGGQTHLLIMSNDISERLRAEEALRESEEKYRTLIEMAHDAIIIGKGNYLDYNKASLDLFGCSSGEQIYGKTPFDFSPPTQPDGSNSKERSKQIVEKAMVGEPQKFYWRHRKVDGTPIETEVSLNRIEVRGDPMLLGIIRDITERKQVEERLRKRESALKIRTNELEETNTALKVLLKRRDEDITEVEQKVLFNVNELVMPYAEKLKKTSLDKQQIAYLNILESNLNNVISPFIFKLSSKALGLTPKEIHVANLVKNGKSSKEIAELLSLSVRTIESHRKSIRAKIGLKNSSINLRARLLSI